MSSKSLNSSNQPLDVSLTGTTTPDQSGPESNGNERVLHISQKCKTGTSPSDSFMSYPGYSLAEKVGVLSFCKWAVRVFYSRLDWLWIRKNYFPSCYLSLILLNFPTAIGCVMSFLFINFSPSLLCFKFVLFLFRHSEFYVLILRNYYIWQFFYFPVLRLSSFTGGHYVC